MIFDASDPDCQDRWRRYDVLDVTRGIWLSVGGAMVTHLDSDAGTYRVVLRDEKGRPYPSPTDPEEVATEERRGRIQVVLKPEFAESDA